MRVRAALATRTATVALLVGMGAAAPLTLKSHGDGWALEMAAAHAESGKGADGGGRSRGGSDDGGNGSDDGGGSGSDDNGSDDGDNSGSGGSGSGGDDSGDSGGSGSGRSGDDDGADDSSGRGSDDVDDDDSSESGRRGRSADDSINDDSLGRRSSSSDDRSRPRAAVSLTDSEVQGILRGERVLVDDRGRVLELEIEIEHGVRTVTVKPHGGDAKRNPGPVEGVRSVPTGGVPGGQVTVGRQGGLEVEVEHGVVTTKPHGGGRAGVAAAPVQSGADLTAAEEQALIQSGWK